MSDTPRTDALDVSQQGRDYHYRWHAYQNLAYELEHELAELRGVLTELVACKDLKDKLDGGRFFVGHEPYKSVSAARDEYMRRQPLAWGGRSGSARESARPSEERINHVFSGVSIMSEVCFICHEPCSPVLTSNEPLEHWHYRNVAPDAAIGGTLKPVHHRCVALGPCLMNSSKEATDELTALRAELAELKRVHSTAVPSEHGAGIQQSGNAMRPTPRTDDALAHHHGDEYGFAPICERLSALAKDLEGDLDAAWDALGKAQAPATDHIYDSIRQLGEERDALAAELAEKDKDLAHKERVISSYGEENQALFRQIAELRKDAQLLQRKLIVDVRLEPAMTICKGCSIRTVVLALAQEWRSAAALEGTKA